MSAGLSYLKNFVNYAIFFVLLSEVYGKYWMNPDVAESSKFIKYVQLMRRLYRVPLNAFDY